MFSSVLHRGQWQNIKNLFTEKNGKKLGVGGQLKQPPKMQRKCSLKLKGPSNSCVGLRNYFLILFSSVFMLEFLPYSKFSHLHLT